MRAPAVRPIAFALLVSLVPVPAIAAGNDPLREAAAAERAGDWKAAAAALARALEAKASPQVEARYATALEKSGRLVAAFAEWTKLQSEKAPDVRATAKKRASELERRLPRVVIDVEPSRGAVVTVDGREVPSEQLGVPVAIDPGSHHVSASATGRTPTSDDVTLAEGESRTVRLVLRRAPAKTREDAAESADGFDGRRLGWVALGVGAAGVAAGAYFGLEAKSQRDTLRTACPNDVCTADHQGLLDTGKKNAEVATIAFGVGAVGLAAGAYLLLFTKGEAAPAPSTGVTVRPFVGATSAGVTGRF